MAAAFLLLALRRFWLRIVIVLDFLTSAIFFAYSHYFHHPMNIEAIRTAREGLSMAGVAVIQISPFVWFGLIALLVLKLFWAGWITPQPPAHRRLLALGFLASIALGFTALQFTSFSIQRLHSDPGDRGVYAYGYVNSWIEEAIWGPNMQRLSEELRQLQAVSPDRLSPTEGKWPFANHIAIVQMESVGWDVLNLKMNGQEVTPFLNQLSRSSRTFRIQSYHDVGSADMDFAVLSDGTPSSTVISYCVPGLIYTNDLPRLLQKHGYHTVSMHGSYGTFFNRYPNFARMGFDEIYFRKSFTNNSQSLTYWGARDGDVFKFSADKMRQAKSPEFHFLITIDTHTPFDLVEDSEKEIFPRSRDWRENYFNSLRVLDHRLETYIGSLPAGTLVILYGDHTAGVTYGDYHSDRVGKKEFVPCIVHICQPDSSWVAAADPPQAPSVDLRVHDVINVLRHQISSDVALSTNKPSRIATSWP